jgi:L-ascorbate metabolism protein UlaG (beta-lactamase superfamily)
MDIKYFGQSSFLIKTKKGATLITDPFDPKIIAMKFPKTEADVVTISHHHPDHDFLGQISGEPLIVDWPGQFERKGIRISGFKSYHDKQKGAERGENILYKIEDELSILHCGDLGVIPDDNFLDEIGEVDVLLVPVGGFYTIDSSEALELVKKIEPSIVIPMHYHHAGDTENKMEPVENFIKKMGAENVAPVPKLTIKKEELGEEMKVVVLEVSS